MSGAVAVRLAGAADRPALVDLVATLVAEYRQPGTAADIERGVDRHLLGDGGCRAALALLDGAPAGLATFAILFPGFGQVGHGELRHLFVRGACRGRGIGRALLAFLARHVRAEGGTRIDWTTGTANTRAIAFYDRLGVGKLGDKVHYRLDGAAFDALAE
jgi:ribosomal protein S18 acetylase RimI-like enzyme